MGYIKIPKIDVFLPIYHGTEENVLQTSIGHLEESSLPVGGESAHSMLSGHRGLPSARLFTDLDKLGEGDTFTMTILNETLTYEVDHIWIVEPSDLSHLTIEDGKDYCTLITCTPYGINTHRLLVRAHRIENVNGNAMVIAKAVLVMSMSLVLPLTSIPVSAAESTQVPDPNRTGSISITFTYYDETAKATKPVTGGNSVGLYKVADVADDNTFKFLTDERFAGVGEIPDTDEALDAASLDLARKMAAIAKDYVFDVQSKEMDSEGKVSFDGLEVGLYLVAQDAQGEGDNRFAITPFLITIPQKNPDGSLVYDVDAAAKPLRVAKEELPPPPTPPHNIPQTGQLWWPVMMLGGLGVLVLSIGMTRKNRTK